MSVIWKFPLEVRMEQRIRMPRDSVIVDVQVQNGQICMWAICNPDRIEVDREFLIIGTGQEFDTTETYYRGTVQNGVVVWHIFERI